MSKRESIIRYNLIIKQLRKRPSNFQEISDSLEKASELHDYHLNISKRTFQRDLDDIRSIYNIDIQYDFKKRTYCIEYEEKEDHNMRILEALDTFQAFNLHNNLSGFVHFEKRKPIGAHHLYGLLHAIKNTLFIEICYEKYTETELSQRKVAPLALKEFKNRWYLLAEDQRDGQVKSFALDRIHDMEIFREKYQRKEAFDVQSYYQNCFGIMSPEDDEADEVILSFNAFQGKYIKSLPLHESQEIIKDTEEELLIKLKVFLTHDFIMELFSYGDKMKVIQPTRLAQWISAMCERMASQYR